jgi:hypothetical protein
LTSALDGGEWSASHPGRFTPRERTPGTHWIGGWVDPRAVLDAVVKKKIPSPRRESKPRTPIVAYKMSYYFHIILFITKERIIIFCFGFHGLIVVLDLLWYVSFTKISVTVPLKASCNTDFSLWKKPAH